MSYPDYEDLARRSRSLAGLIAWDRSGVLVRTRGQAESHTLNDVSRNYFSVLGIKPWTGSFFAPATGWNATGEPEVVISHRLWTRRFGSAPDVVGSTIYLNGRAHAIVGIAPPGFRGLEFQAPVDLWITIDSLPALVQNANYMRRDAGYLDGLGRLRQGATLEQARAELSLIAQQLGQEYPATDKECEVQVDEAVKKSYGYGFYLAKVMMWPVNLVLFIACVNIANLMLALAARERRETAIRAALGAGRLRIFRQFLTESVLLSIGGTAIGLLLAAGLVYGLNRVSPWIIPVDYDIHMDRWMLLYSILLAFAMGVAFGVWPAIQASRRNALVDLNPSTGAFTGGRGRMPVLKGLLIVQIAAAQLLVAAAFAFLSSYARAMKMNLGLDVDRRLLLAQVVSFDLSKQTDWGRIAGELGALPGVRRATYAGPVPLGDSGMFSLKIAVPGANAPDSTRSVDQTYVGPGYFGVLGTRVLAGRDFDRQDVPASRSAVRVIGLNQTAARRLWPNTPPNQVVGRWIRAEGYNNLQVVAVVEDGKYSGFYEQPQECVFVPISSALGEMTLVVEAAGEPSALVGLVRRELHEAHPDLEFVTASTMKQHLERARRLEIAGSVLLGVLGALAVALACVGLYGSASYTASSRSRELGIRIALGAQRGELLWLCLRQGAAIALTGLAVGLAAAYALTQAVSRALVGAGGASFFSFLASVMLIGSIAMLAIFVPARRATRADPALALRAE
jgi:putative ABC transport system permease protein